MNAISGVFVKELSPEDMAAAALVPKAVKAPAISKIRDRHHTLAAALVSGMKEQDAALALGYSLSRISILKSDPAFIQLLDFYREQKTTVRVNDLDRFRILARSAVEELLARIDEAPELLSEDILVKIASFGADRSGLGPITKNLTVHSSLSPQDIAALKAEGDSCVQVISSEDREARVRRTITSGAGDSGEVTEVETICIEEGYSIREESSPRAEAAQRETGSSGNVVPFPVD